MSRKKGGGKRVHVRREGGGGVMKGRKLPPSPPHTHPSVLPAR